MTGERSVADVLQDILRSLQEILRSEVRLAEVEIREEATQAASSALWVGAGIVCALSGWMFLLWAATYALATIMTMWTATLVIAVAIACAGSMLIATGKRRLKRVTPIPERTMESVKENIEWMKQPTR